MVKPDVKHNYYADLELPTSASIDDIRKQYRKLALQYHPDRNAGREDECVPKFQAIQAANEVLGDPTSKQKYDTDRRKVGLYPSASNPTFNPRQSAPGNPYAASSAYPPPLRRTQPGTYRPPQNAGSNGADRFANFPRPQSSPKKDPAQDRTNVFRAWQNMGSGQDRQQRQSQPGPPPQPQAPTARRPPPPPPPRAEGNMPTEDQIRAGMKYRHAPPPFDAEGADKRRTEWSAFQAANAGKPGLARNSSTRTPRKQGFNPNAPGSDERPAPTSDAHYFHRNHSEEFGRERPGVKVPPPPPGRPPSGPASPHSPLSPTSQPRQFNSRVANEQVPFAEGNRKRTPYTNFIGEQTDFSGEGLRRSYSSHDTSKLGPDDSTNRSRARSTSPVGRQRPSNEDQHHDSHRKGFIVESSSEASESDADRTRTPEDFDSSTGARRPDRPGTAPNAANPFHRPKIVPTSRRANGATGYAANRATDGAQSEGEQPSMQQKTKSNMYADPSSPSSANSWTARMFGSYSTSRAKRAWFKVPNWAIPSSINPSLKGGKQPSVKSQAITKGDPFVTAADELFISATKAEQDAYFCFQSELEKEYGYVPNNLDMEVFLKVASTARKGESHGDPNLDWLISRVLFKFPTVGGTQKNMTDERLRPDRFPFPQYPNMYETSNAKSRSEENINTNFSPDGWHGAFTGEPDYFAPPMRTGKKQPSPTRRPTANKPATPQPRSATMDVPTSAPRDEVPQRPWGSDGTPSDIPRYSTSTDAGFSQDEWQKRFQDASWTIPGPPPNPPSPGKSGGGARKQTQPRRASKAVGKKSTGARQQPHAVDEDDTVRVEDVDGRPERSPPVLDDVDAMDIDNTPPPQHNEFQSDGPPSQTNSHEKEARLYSVPPSAWRQEQEQKQHTHHRKTSSASKKAYRTSTAGAAQFNANLDDLRNVEPLVETFDAKDGFNLSSMSSNLPFESQASSSAYNSTTPRMLTIPPLPRAPPPPQRLSKASWHAHATAVGEYMKAFHNFDAIMLKHFEARHQEVQEHLAHGTGWLEATGDTSGMLSGPSGFGNYGRAIQEDAKVREAWVLGWEKHGEAMKSFRDVRDAVRKLAVGGTLVDH